MIHRLRIPAGDTKPYRSRVSYPPGGPAPIVRAVLAVRIWLRAGDTCQDHQAWWRSERRIRAALGGRAGIAHIPYAEVHWPTLDTSPYAGPVWAIEGQLTPKPLSRTTATAAGTAWRPLSRA